MTELVRLFKRAVLQTILNEGVPALLGKVDGTLFYVDDNGTHHKDRVWARIGVDAAQVETVVRCVNVPQTLNLPVIVADRDGVLTVIRTDVGRAVDWSDGQFVNVEPHNWTHDRFGSDPTYITGLSFLPLAAYPASPPDLTVVVERCFYRYQGTHKVFERTTSASFSAYRPAGTEVTHYVILALDRSTNTLDVIDGADVAGGNRALPSASTVLATSGVLPQHFPIAAIRLYNGQTQIFPRDIFMDLRLWAGESSASGSGAAVEGPTSSTDNAIARWDGTTGLVLQDSYPTIDDSGNMDLAGNELRDYSHQIVTANTGANYEIDWSAATVFELTLTASATFTFSNLGAGRAITLILIQDGTGGRTVTWPAVSWANGTAPRLSSTAAAVNVVTLLCQNDGSTVSGFSEGDHFDERGVVFSDGGSDTSNFFAGNDAGRTAATGTEIVAIGQQAGDAITTGSEITAVGYQAGSFLTTGAQHTLIGTKAGEFVQTGDNNVGVGVEVLGQVQAGIENVAVGDLALKGNGGLGGSDVDDCTAVGFLALRNVLNGADEGVAVGAYSGFSVTTAARVILLGAYAGYRQTTTSDILLIDNRLRADAATELTHALLYGVMGANPEDQALTVNADVLNVGTDADADVVMTWKANTNNGVITWYEDEDRFQFDDDVLLPDNEKVLLGTGADMALYYDGTDGRIDTDLVAASDLVIDCGTDKTIELTETVWDDFVVPVNAIRLAGASPADPYAYKSGSVLSFDSSTDEYVYFVIQLPHRYKEGTDVIFHIHWTIVTSGAGAGAENVKWDMTYSASSPATPAESWPAASNATVTIDVQSDSADDHLIDNVATITGTNFKISEIIICSLKRDTTVANNYSDEVLLVSADVHYEVDTMGSRQTLAK